MKDIGRIHIGKLLVECARQEWTVVRYMNGITSELVVEVMAIPWFPGDDVIIIVRRPASTPQEQ